MTENFGLKVFALVGLALVVSGCGPTGNDDNSVFSAVRNNDEARVGQYLAEGGDPDVKNGDGDTLLYVASGAKGGPEVVRKLLLGGADPDLLSREGRTPLHTAAAWCNTNSVSLLFEAKARTDIKNAEGKLAIDSVCVRPAERREQVMELFLQARAAE